MFHRGIQLSAAQDLTSVGANFPLATEVFMVSTVPDPNVRTALLPQAGAFPFRAFDRIHPSHKIHQKPTKLQRFRPGVAYYGYRYYDPTTGRWPSRDPIEEMGGVNIYAIVGNNSNNQIDVLGLRHCTSKRIDINIGSKEFKVGNGKITFKLQIRGTAEACDDCTKTLSTSITGAVGSDIPVVAPFIVTVSGNVSGNVTATFDANNNNSDVFGDLSVQGWVGGGVSAGVGKAVVEGGLSANWDVSGDADENQVSLDLKGKDVDFNARLRVTVGFGSWEYNAIPYQFSTRVGKPPDFSASIALPGFP
jgi:RHS repeat-associated protein